MVGKNNQYLKTTKQGTKVESYSIKKFKVGTASVVIGASIFLGAGAVAQASEEISNNTTVDSTTNAAVKEEAPKAVEKAATVENTKESVASAVATKVGAETPKTAEKAEVKVNKEILKASIASLEAKIKSAPDADKTAVETAKEVLAAAKAVLANDAATQEEVNAQVQTVQALSTVVTEAQAAGVTVKAEEKKAEEKAKSEAKQSTEVKEAKKELTQVVSEAEVTNVLANEAMRKNEVKLEAKPAVVKAVAKNEEVIKVANELLGNDEATKEQVAKSLAELSESIKAVYAELENAGVKRNGKYDVVLADIADTVAEPPLSEEEQVKHWEKYKDKNTARLTKQIKWFDVGSKTATVENLGSGDKLQVGTKFTQEISPGYVVTLTVTKLAPFNSTDAYKERGGAGYDANAQNVYKDGTPAELKVVTQGSYSVAKTNGMNTGGKTVIQSVKDGANVGVEFSVKATLNGKEVPANVVFLTGEEAGSSEVEIYKTDGDGFELVTELSNSTVKNQETVRSYTAETYEKRTLASAGHGQHSNQLGVEYTLNGSGKPAFEPFKADKAAGFFNTTVTSDTVIAIKAADGKYHVDGLGTQIFGPVSTHRASGFSTPLVMTRNAKNVGMYIMASGQQGSMLGFMLLDEGDAPASYGRVAHSISKSNGQKQPYLGSVAPDVDIRTTPITKTTAFKYDDNNGDGAADEGARQLMGDGVQPNDNYTLHKVNDTTYSMTFDAHLDGESSAWVNGWIDFNGNGKFDEGESATPTEVTKDGKVTLTWNTQVQNVDTTATKLATRLRIALDKADITTPTGIAYSGEVEDFQIQQTIPPRGTKEETSDVQGATQNATVQFNAYGQINYDFSETNTIDTTVKSQIVKPDGSLVTDADLVDGYYVVQGQGKYKITDNGKDVNVEFIPEANFVGTADGITIRRTDANGATTGWGLNGNRVVKGEGEDGATLNLISDQIQLQNSPSKGSMDGRYIPTVTPKPITGEPKTSKDVQGKAQKETPVFKTDAGKDNEAVITPSATHPAKLVDPKTGKPTEEASVTVENEGTYTINPTTGEVTFQPLPTFTGRATGISVSLTAPVGQDKNGQPVTSTATTTYTPEVTPVKPTADPATSTGIQGETQTGTPTFTAGHAEVPIKDGSVKLLNADGTEANGAVPALDNNGNKVGEYTVDPAGVVTFTPTDKTYVGPVVPAKVQAEDNNGTKVETKYTPSIVGVKPTATPAESSNIQGEAQSGTVVFAPGKATIEGVEKSVAIKANSAVLLDKEGNPVAAGTPVDAVDENGKKVGEYTIDPSTNTVTFTPNKDFVGTPVPATVQAKDANGTSTTATYTPTVKPVTPEGINTFTEDIQGAPQSGKPQFTPGKTTINGKEVEVPMDDNTPAKLVDPTTGQEVTSVTIPGEGTYTVDPDGTVHFTPDKQFTGKGQTLKVVRQDTNGTKVTAEYTAVVKPASPEGTEVLTAGVQGKEQSGRPNFIGGKAEVNGVEKTVDIDTTKPAKLIDPTTNQEVDKVVIPGEGTYTVAEDGTVTFTPEKGFVGKGTELTVKRVDLNGTPALGKYTAVVIGTKPTAEPSVTSDIQGQTQSHSVKFKGGTVEVENPMTKAKTQEAVAIDPTTYTLLDENGQKADKVPAKDSKGNVIGEYTLVKEEGKDPVAVFTPTDKTYTGEVKPVTVQAKDTNGVAVTTTYTPNITPVTPTAKAATSEGAQGKEQTGTPTFAGGHPKAPIDTTVPAKLIDPETGEPTDEKSVTVPGEGTYTVAEDGTVTFTPEPNFTGKAEGVEVQRVDTNGTPATAKYTPTVKPVTPTSKDAISEDIQGAEQTGTPVFTPGKTTIKGEEVTIEIDPDVKPSLVGADEEGKVVVPNEGTYTIDENGVVTFTPESNFTGKASGVTVKRVDKNGTEVTAKYTPTVKPVTPTAKGTTTTDIQGSTQTGTPVFTPGKATVNGVEKTVELSDKPAKLVDPKTGDPVDSVIVDGEGTYTVSPEGTVTFVPNKDFTGQATGVTVKREDKNGTPVTAKYTPVVLPVTPTAKDTTSIGDKGEKQSETPVFKAGTTKLNGKTVVVPIDEKVVPTLEGADKEGKVVVPNEGTYTIDKEGKVTFTPEPNFVGKASGVTVKRVDENGTPVTATYTPTVIGKATTKDVTSEGAKNTPQSNTPEFKGDVDTKVAPTFKDGSTTKEVPGQGIYTIDKDGKVTFTPEKDFVGTATPVEVVRKDKNGRTIKASYTPTVRPDTKFVVVGKDGKETELIPSKDGKNPAEKISEYKVVKTETDEKGNTKHIYEKVTTKHVDSKGNPIPGTTTEEGTKPNKAIPGYKFVETKTLENGDTEHVYEKVTTKHVDSKGNPIPGTTTEEGTKDPKTPKEVPGYKVVKTTTTEDGDTVHTYEKVTTKHVDSKGNPIPGTTTEEGEQPAKTPKEVPGYKVVKTTTLENGDIEHIYEKVTTSFKDKEGNVIPNYPTEEGTTPKKDIPGYKFVETKTLENGDTEHVYEKVTPPTPTPTPVVEKTTTWVDENGKELKTPEIGEKISGEVPGYEFVRTVVDGDGNVKHVFKPVSRIPEESRITIWTDEEGNSIKVSEKGTHEHGEVPGYEFVKTIVDKDGKLHHIFREVPAATPKAQVKRLANTGTTETNTGLAGLGLGILGGLLAAARRRKEK